MPVSYAVLTKKILYNLANISVFFSKRFPPWFLVTLQLRARGFFMRGKGMWLLHLLGISTCIFVIYTGNANVPELCVVARWRIIATLVNILREQGNEPNFGGNGGRRLGKLIWYNETFTTSADSDQLTHPHENGRYNLHADCTIWWKNK